MARPRKVFRCSSCGFLHYQWMGRCNQCGLWNTLEEDVIVEERPSPSRSSRVKPMVLNEITADMTVRRTSLIGELDRVLGGGVVQGSFVLIGGDPGIGKSTLMLQMAHSLDSSGLKVLYVSGEESAPQIRLRAQRLGLAASGIVVFPEVLMESIREEVDGGVYDLAIIDSIQSVYSESVGAPPGSVSQIRHCAGVLMEIAKARGVTVFIVGHVTKEGLVAGPKMLEHMVDTVLSFEGDDTGAYRIVRTSKNRFGTSGEIGVFEMKQTGLHEVKDPSAIFIHGLGGESPGSAVMATCEGSRAFVVEVQALVSRTTYSMPRRITMGSDPSRLAVLLAVMEKRAGVYLAQSDIVVNIAGGFRVTEPAVDLSLVMAIVSSAFDRPVPRGMVFIGEIGLSGELRPVSHMESRVREALKMGFTRIIIPEANRDSLSRADGAEVRALPDVSSALKIIS
ncbi:MAG TPA: DNA repair protein RadA [Deltaproteobacteria bacterium]|nr:DNA repair protein RadA [Deltaproteobacteria bacterium]HRW79252.1 DNA repair protein RadA [Desulfomonilia bacterium]HNQ85132.1 DNA repair protein RadA [Deltaproteobacteria bacterium]HNS89432.1 DNA repair protein RadA [Deltaproteobacteria bacterium]HOA43711.1 DNA repair protein RadA [Deltaproteobacteria bacterium]